MARFKTPLLAVVVFASLTLAAPASAEWNEKVLYSLQGGSDGANPSGGVVMDSAGNLYSATFNGGATNCPGIADCGTVFEVSPPVKPGDPWTETVLYVFKGKSANDGSTPGGGVLLDKAGNVYGSTSYGGSGSCVLLGIKTGCGTVFLLSPPAEKGGAWTETILYSFKGGDDGYLPNGDLTMDSAGNLYGVTLFGGGKGAGLCDPFYQGCGTVFKLSRPTQNGGKWIETVLHRFAAGSDGYNPYGGLLLDENGNLYGAAPMGGNQLCNFGDYKVGCGILFKLIRAKKMCEPWTEEIIHRFTFADGIGPQGKLIFDGDRRLYGSANGGNAAGCGLIYRMTSNGGHWSESILYEFTCGNDGQGPGPVVMDKVGNLYGASIGGPLHFGVLFRLQPPSGPETAAPWTFDLLYTFKGDPDCGHPAGDALLLGRDDDLYGTAGGGTANEGCVFEASP
jgi:hypothetical protein